MAATLELQAQVAEALNSVIDPCSTAVGAPAGLRDMGLITKVDIALVGDNAHVSVVLRLTHPSCIMGPLFIESIEHALLSLPAVDSASVSLAADYSWTEEDMADEYRERLAAHRSDRSRRSSVEGRPSHVWKSPVE